jgi:hypothetical protein
MSKLNERLTLVANLSVVAGIIFLAAEVSQSAEATRAEIKNALSESSRDQGLWAAEHPEVLTLDQQWAAGEPLTDVEQIQVASLYYARWKNLENAYYQSESGTLEPAEWQAYERITEARANLVTHSAYLEEHGWRFSSDFIEYVSGLRR